MKKYTVLFVALLLTALFVNLSAQTKSYPFEIKKSGKGKQAIIFIPGFASSDAVWDETKAKFENDFTCYSLTMAGFAGVQPQTDPTFKKWATGIANYIQDNKIEKPILIGHSMGGALALAIASDFPDLLDKIVVVDALPCLPAVMNPSFQPKEKNDCSAMVNQFTAISDEQFKKMQSTSVSQLCQDKTMQNVVLDWSIKTDRKTFAEMYCDFFNTDLREKIKNIKCRNLILLESYFANMKPTIEEQYKNLKTGNLQYANKGLHFIMYDDKEWYFTQLNNFLTAK